MTKLVTKSIWATVAGTESTGALCLRCHMTSTGPVGIGDKMMRKSVCMGVTAAQYQTGRLWNPVVCIFELSHDQYRTGRNQ